MLECCKTCGAVKFEENEDLNMNVPVCPHFNFVSHLELGDEVTENRHIENLHGYQQVVRIGRKIFGVETNFDPYAGTTHDESDIGEFINDQLPPLRKERLSHLTAYGAELAAAKEFLAQDIDIEPVLDLEQSQSKFTSFDRVPEYERDRMMNEVMRPDLARADVDDDEDRDAEDLLFVAGRSNRFGFRYRFLGHNVYKALIEPFMWQHVCEHGYHRFNKSVFASEISSGKSDISPLLVNKLAKVLYSETMVKTNEHTAECMGCYFPVAQGESLCPFCGDDFAAQAVYQAKAKKVISSMDRVMARELDRQHTTTIADMVQANGTVEFIVSHGRRVTPFREKPVSKTPEEREKSRELVRVESKKTEDKPIVAVGKRSKKIAAAEAVEVTQAANSIPTVKPATPRVQRIVGLKQNEYMRHDNIKGTVKVTLSNSVRILWNDDTAEWVDRDRIQANGAVLASEMATV